MTTQPILVVGAGFFGLTIARQIVEHSNLNVVVVESRSHIGGNAWSEKDPETGIEIHKYGSHIFHTNHKWIWDYVNRFSKFNHYRHTVFSRLGDKYVSMPVNLQTISQIYGEPVTPESAAKLIARDAEVAPENPSFEDLAIEKIGRPIYENLFKNYTLKQWQTDPKELPGDVFTRLPFRLNFENRYFTDDFEGIPEDGYGELFRNMVDHPRIQVRLETDFFHMEEPLEEFGFVVYTGPVDKYFDFQLGRLGWRTVDFVLEKVSIEDFQGTSVINYPELSVDFTRIHEYRHYTPDFTPLVPKTVIAKEYSRFANEEDLPYYPISSPSDRKMMDGYRDLIKAENRVFFGGRLGTYKYLDMHAAIASAFNLFENDLKKLI